VYVIVDLTLSFEKHKHVCDNVELGFERWGGLDCGFTQTTATKECYECGSPYSGMKRDGEVEMLLQDMEVLKWYWSMKRSLEGSALLVSCGVGLLNPIFVAMPLSLMVNMLTADAWKPRADGITCIQATTLTDEGCEKSCRCRHSCLFWNTPRITELCKT